MRFLQLKSSKNQDKAQVSTPGAKILTVFKWGFQDWCKSSPIRWLSNSHFKKIAVPQLHGFHSRFVVSDASVFAPPGLRHLLQGNPASDNWNSKMQQKTTVLGWFTVIYGVYCGSIQGDCVWKCVETTYAIFTALRCLSLHQIWTAAWQWVNSELPEIRKRVVFTFIAWRQFLSVCILPLFALAFALLIFSPCWSNAFVQLGDSFVLFCDCLHGSRRRI